MNSIVPRSSPIVRLPVEHESRRGDHEQPDEVGPVPLRSACRDPVGHRAGLALIITQAGVGVAPLIIVGVAVAYLATLLLADRRAKPPATAT